jgi:transposase
MIQDSPDHSSFTVIRDRLSPEVRYKFFTWVLALAKAKKLLDGEVLAVDSTTLEANAAMKSIVRRNSEENWREYMTKLMRESGTIATDATPAIEELKRFGKSCRNKQVSNDVWKSPSISDSRIAQWNDGTTHLAYKAEHAADLKTEMIVAAEISLRTWVTGRPWKIR